MGRSIAKAKVLSRVFSEDYQRGKSRIFDPRGQAIRNWSKVFLMACLISLFVDPLFFIVPVVGQDQCIELGVRAKVILTVVRSVADVFYVIQILVRFHTAYVAPSSRVVGRGELILVPSKIARRYLHGGFWMDLLAALPLPQIMIWEIVPRLSNSVVKNTKSAVWFAMILQYLPRLLFVIPLSSEILEVTGVVSDKPWAAAAYNLMFYLLASHFLGCWWYLQSIERVEECWLSVCNLEKPGCRWDYFDCKTVGDPGRNDWYQSTNVTTLCNGLNTFYQFGIYWDGVANNVQTSGFSNKWLYCLWWGMRNLSSFGQNLLPSTYVGELVFTLITASLGVSLFTWFIGNVQLYLLSSTKRFEKLRIRIADTEEWMHHRQLPPELRKAITEYEQYKWIATRGVDEDAILHQLPSDLRREIKRHLCLSLVRQVPLFDHMNETLLDAICERLKPVWYTENMFLICEGEPLDHIFLIIRGHLESHTTNGGQVGFFNSIQIGSGDFCGEELLTWAMDARSRIILPSSTRTVKAISRVEALAIRAEDLRFVASHFRTLRSEQLKHALRFYSQQWRTWAALFIQAAWRRHRRRKQVAQLRRSESLRSRPTPGSFWDVYAEKLVQATAMSLRKQPVPDSDDDISLQKPTD